MRNSPSARNNIHDQRCKRSHAPPKKIMASRISASPSAHAAFLASDFVVSSVIGLTLELSGLINREAIDRSA